MKKVACHHLRSYVLSIYLIKIADRKIKEQELAAEKEQESQKRQLGEYLEYQETELNNGRKIPHIGN